LLLKSRVLLKQGKFEIAEATADEALRLAEEMDYMAILWKIRNILAEALMLSGKKAKAGAEYLNAYNEIKELSENISEENLKLNFISNPIVRRIRSLAGISNDN
jgi:hypothetical protein